MKNIDFKQLDEKDERIVNALISLGMNRPVAKVLTYLQHADEVKSGELEMGTDLRQPEVSIAMNQLKELDWINEREQKKPGKGRPYKIYSLKIGFTEIVGQLEKQQRKMVDEMQGRIKRLKELGKS